MSSPHSLALSGALYLGVLLALSSHLGCATHIGGYEPKHREYEATYTQPEAAAEKSLGSLYSDSGALANPYADVRARLPGDVVTVIIDERTMAEHDAATNIERTADEEARLKALFGALAVLQEQVPEVALDPAVEGSASSKFDGKGSTSQRESIRATIPCTVRKVLSSGNLFIEGHRAILVNLEEQHLYVSGVVRPEDVDSTNTIMSTRIVDAEIEFTGSGSIAEKQRPGWFSRLLHWAWPF